MTDGIKNTALTDIHIGLGAKMVAFAGFNMPVLYEGINIEHEAVRKGVGIFDVSHMGQFILKGKQALGLIQKISTNDASTLAIGKVQYSCMTNEAGGIIDDLLVYRIGNEEYMLVVNASNIEKDFNWIQKNKISDVEITDISDRTSLLAVQGPRAIEVLQLLTSVRLTDIPYYSFAMGDFAGVSDVLISNTGYTGAGGFEIYFQNKEAVHFWKSIFSAGKGFEIKPIGLGARDTLRLEMGYCLYGNDINDSITPLEADLGWITKFSKPFVASSILEYQKDKRIEKKLIGFEMIDRGVPRHDYLITNGDGNVIGKVTSGTQSPSLQKGIGMGYVPIDFAKEGNVIYILIRDRNLKARVVKRPFIKSQIA
jgi:aminomethyltransferase